MTDEQKQDELLNAIGEYLSRKDSQICDSEINGLRNRLSDIEEELETDEKGN